MAIMLIDTRETKPLRFEPDGLVTGTRRETLAIGDYQLELLTGQRLPLVFDRKSLPDLFHTMTSGYHRFKRRLLEAQAAHLSLCLIIEGTLSEVFHGVPHSQFDGASCIRKLFTLAVRYGCYPVFCASRAEMAAFILEASEAVERTIFVDSARRPRASRVPPIGRE